MSPIRPPEVSPDGLSTSDGEVQLPLLPDLSDLTELPPLEPEPVVAGVAPPSSPATAPPSPDMTPAPWSEATPARWRVRLALGLSALAAWIGIGGALFVYVHAHHGASTPSIPQKPLQAVPPGLPAIPSGTSVPFSPRWGTTVPGDTITSIPGGVEYTVGDAGREQWLLPGSPATYPHLRVDADVQMVRGEQLGDGAGLGCASANGSVVLFFYAYSDAVTVHETDGTTSSVLGRYATGVDRPGQANHMTMLCDSPVPGTAEVMIAIDGTTVYDQTLSIPGARWWSSAISLCSCGGPSQATYRGLTESALAS